MRWEQRKPLWPIVVALSLLFILALAAPQSWQADVARQRQQEGAQEAQPEPKARHASAETLPAFESPVFEVAETAPAVVPSDAPAAPVGPVRTEFDFDTLRTLRDLLLSLVQQRPSSVKSIAPEASTWPRHKLSDRSRSNLSQVRVGSDRDRLAMLPSRARFRAPEPTPAPAVEVTDEEVANFAATLLEAARVEPAEPLEAAELTETAQPVRPTEPAESVASIRPALPHFARRTVQPAEPVQPVEPIQQAGPVLQVRPVQPATPVRPTRPRWARRTPAPDPVETVVVAKPKLAVPDLAQPPVVAPPPLRHLPQKLISQLESFSVNSPGASWSQQVLAELRLLTDEQIVERPAVAETLGQLERLHIIGLSRSDNPAVVTVSNPWLQAAQALGRRLVVWRLLLDPERPMISGDVQTSTTLPGVLQEISSLLADERNGADWRNYLLLDQIAAATSFGMGSAPLKRTKLAQEVLSRMEDPRLTAQQEDFLATAPLVRLHQELRPWAAGKVNLETLAALVERYEAGREIRFAAAIAQLQQRLKWSDDSRLQALADHFEQHYRGANMRIAMSGELLNRMMPKQEPVVTPVRDRIAGAKVRGRARTTTNLRVRLVPDSNAWHFGLEANGKVYSDTRSDTWPARIRNAAKMHYQGRKEISIDEQGLHVSPAQAQAQGRNELLGVDSQLDPIPILGPLLRDLARQKHSKSRPTAINQAKAKVVRQVKLRMNETTDEKLVDLERKFREKVLAPINQLALLAEPLDMHTTGKRAVMQLRLANIGQLAAHTLRPLAPSDSLLSMQMHETTLNNAMMGLGLEGRRMTLIEVFEFFAQRFGQADAVPPEDLPRAATIEFAARDTFRLHCDEDRLELILNIAELAYRRDKIKNFQVHVHFRPALNGLQVKLVRDGALQFSGRRLKTGPRVVLHSVIGKLLEENKEIDLLSSQLRDDPRLAGLMVTQLVIDDGWIGLALGPNYNRRTAWRTSGPEVLRTPFVR